MTNTVTFVSLGPGDPELITLKALKCLQKASAIYCPGTTAKTGKIMSRARKIMTNLGIDTAKINVFDVPMSKERTLTKKDYEATAQKIQKHLETATETIAVCAQGDASFYSSIYYISELLAAQNIEIKRIAGVPAFIAAGTLANIHIVKQEERLRVIPGVVTYEDLEKECQTGNTVVIMKTPQSEAVIKKAIQTLSNTEFHYFENVGVTEKEFYTNDKSEILERKFPYFSLLIIKSAQQ